MNPTKKKILYFVLYDSITNSIFESQVFSLLKKISLRATYSNLVLISFESKPICLSIQRKLYDHGIELIILKKRMFLGMWSLFLASKALTKILKNSNPFELIARGPHAGFLALHATQNTHCTALTIQARGLLTQEYLYAHRMDKKPLHFLHTLRAKLFYKLEQTVYRAQSSTIPLTFQAVSPALKEYLINEFKTDPSLITLAQEDIPQTINKELIINWRTATRTKLGIPTSSFVYCYNGSAKAWQCPQEVIHFFKKELENNKQAFLLILTQDKKTFEKLLQQYALEPSRFYVTTIAHQEIYQYLAAADTGLLFREKNIINWVSRPTKALEYQAVGLNIIHNDTVAWLQKQTSNHSRQEV